jgi:hypothetical protein
VANLFPAAVDARGYSTGDFTNQNNRVALFLEPLRGDVRFLIDQTDHANGWRRIDHTCRALII